MPNETLISSLRPDKMSEGKHGGLGCWDRTLPIEILTSS